VRFVTETKGVIGGLAKEAFVVLAVTFVGDLASQEGIVDLEKNIFDAQYVLEAT
jgi:hypothetical protein